MFTMFKDTNIKKQQFIEFKTRLIRENSIRFLYLLCLVIASQIVFLTLELLKVMDWERSIFISRIIVTVLCSLFVGLIYIFRKKENKSIALLGMTTSIIQFLSISVGAYFTVQMFYSGIYSLSAFLLVSFIVSLTCVRNPYYSGIILIIFFLGLTAYIHIYVLELNEWLGEFLIALVFSVLIYIGNIFNYGRHLRLFIQEKEIISVNAKLKEMSIVDELTGIYNRRKVIEVIQESINYSKRYSAPFCIAILDLDHFKKINDKYGHNVGDNVLKEFTKILQRELRTTDILGRWGGEEFIIIAPNTSENGMLLLIERLRNLVEKYKFEMIEKITFSAGIKLFIDEKSYSEIIEKADFALYTAKSMGRNQVQIYKPQ